MKSFSPFSTIYNVCNYFFTFIENNTCIYIRVFEVLLSCEHCFNYFVEEILINFPFVCFWIAFVCFSNLLIFSRLYNLLSPIKSAHVSLYIVTHFKYLNLACLYFHYVFGVFWIQLMPLWQLFKCVWEMDITLCHCTISIDWVSSFLKFLYLQDFFDYSKHCTF